MKVQANNNIHYSYPYKSNVAFRADLFNKKALKAANEALAESKIQNQALTQHIKQLENLITVIKTECQEIGKVVTSEKSFNKKLLEIQNRLQFIPFVNQEYKDNYRQTILKKLEEPLSYNPLNPVYEKVEGRDFSWKRYIYNYKKIPFKPIIEKCISTSKLISELDRKRCLEIDFPVNPSKKVVSDKNAFIGNKQIPELNITQNTDMTAVYGRRVNWSNEKIARDILQNFYDAHGHTLEGTNISIKKLSKGYRIRISGQSQYNYKNIQYIGSGDKENDLYNAGGFGEGTKILSAVLLGKEKTRNIRFSSADWNIDFGRTPDKIEDSIITRTLRKQSPIAGNYIEFETTDKSLVEKIIEARNYFYHPNNPDFKNLTYENKDFAFKLLPKGEKGNLYLTQRFEYERNGAWNNNLDDITLIFKRRTTNKDFKNNRDRIKFSKDEIKELLSKDFVKTMSDKDLVTSLLKLEPLWNESLRGTETGSAGDILIKVLIKETDNRDIIIDFGDNKMAACNYLFDSAIIHTLENIGYDICVDDMFDIGMKNGKEIYKATRKHVPLMPTETEKKKLLLLEEGISLLADDSVMKTRINLNEAKKPRFIFDAKEAKEDNTLAESVIKNKEYLGHWVDRKYLNNAEFYNLLGAWLHEITHKYGGDGTNVFGYKLTDVMGMELESLMNDPIKAEKLRILRDIFNELG